MTTEDDPSLTGAMLALVPTAANATRLAVPGGEPADDLHVTIAYLGKAADLDTITRQQLIGDVAAAANGLPAIDADVFALSVFNPGGPEPCITLGLSGDMLDAVHHFLTEQVPLPPVEQQAPWQPHITVRYTDDFTGLADLADRVGPVRFDRLRIAFAGQNLDIPLVADAPVLDTAPVDLGLAEADLHPGDGSAERLKRYWLAGPGLAKWADSPHPWTSLFRQLADYIKNPTLLKKTVSSWYRMHFGHMPNQKESAGPTLVEVAIAESGRYDPT